MPSGAAWEARAERYLQRAGLRPLERNYRCRLGEIDLVMEDGETLVFVEVRFRDRTDFGTGAETVGHRKRHRLINAARHYLSRKPRLATRPCRFDVVSISGRFKPDYDWISDAFQLDH